MTGVFLCGECGSTVYQAADGGGCPCCGYCTKDRRPSVNTTTREDQEKWKRLLRPSEQKETKP